MPRHLTEKYVQRKAVEWLVDQVKEIHAGAVVESKLEAVLKKDPALPGRGRADGLVAARLQDGSIYTHSLEAKSHRTLRNLRAWMSTRGKVVMVILALLAAAGAWTLWHSLEASWFAWLLGPLAFVAGFFALLVVTEAVLPSAMWDADVVRQSLRYPARQRWIAISTDAVKHLDDTDERSLRAMCRRHGIGLLVVSHRGRVEALERPTARKPPGDLDDCLACYCDGERIRLALNAG